MGKLMDVHSGFHGLTYEQLLAAHQGDLALQDAEGVSFDKAWSDPVNGKVFCLSTGPSKEAVQRVHARNGIPTDEIYELTSEV